MLSQKTSQKQKAKAFYSFCGNKNYAGYCFVTTIILSLLVDVNMVDTSYYYGNELVYLVNLFLGYIMLITATMAFFLAGAYLGVKVREK